MAGESNFQHLPKPPADSALDARPTEQHLRALLAERVTARFTRLTGLTTTLLPMDLATGHDRIDPQSWPVDPGCADVNDPDRCCESLKSHVAQLALRPEVHWHRCENSRFCAMVPLAWHRRCLAVCRLVCPPSMTADTFERYVEFLDVLIENFILTQGELLSELAPPVEDRGQGLVQSSRRGQAGHEDYASNPQILKAIEYIDEHLTDPELTVAGIARHLNLNAAYLAHLFSEHVGIRMTPYIAARRVEVAKKLLLSTKWQIKRIAFESGHTHADWFSQVFRAQTGLTPSQYRKRRGAHRP